ncbi:hypothetical protein NIES4072_44110 [Nostoc commune NIES-4072]|uniref:Uncharacterized protein n=1 Tax=Nostoc commune NIES-4072 TaxID=2005467 RepID=A0A2R5FRR8_NOSCO|nr:hypothetical protein NIES4070_46720 [Nostoc commune HK-02]GBG20729.1 hypothetical protein NIES4072_44110 [Nostoc commune NIES-4072]
MELGIVECVRTEFVTHYYQGFDAVLSVLTHPTDIFSKSNRIPIVKLKSILGSGI